MSKAGLEVVTGDVALLKIHALRFNSFVTVHAQVPDFHVRWARDTASSRRRYLFIFINRGAIEVEGTHWSTERGGLCVVFPGSAPVDIRTVEPCELILFSFDRREVAPHILTPDNIGDPSPSSTVFRASFSFLYLIAQPPAASDQLAENTTALHALTREVARAITSTAIARDLPHSSIETALALIAERSHDPLFDSESLAHAFGISRRTLNRVFTSNGLRVAKEIRRSRAKLALSHITSHPDWSLDKIAEASGFGSRSSMNRGFKEIYGVPPKLGVIDML